MGEMAPTVRSSCSTRPTADKPTPMTTRAGACSVEEIGLSTKRPQPGAIKEADGKCSKTHRWRDGKRPRILLGILVALSMIHVMAGVNSGFLGVTFDSAAPLDRCVTEQAVLSFLDGKPVVSMGLTNPGASTFETITLRKEKISSLKTESGDDGTVLLRFIVDHYGRQLPVEASFRLTHHDSPELHWHGWVLFMGQVVSSR